MGCLPASIGARPLVLASGILPPRCLEFPGWASWCPALATGEYWTRRDDGVPWWPKKADFLVKSADNIFE